MFTLCIQVQALQKTYVIDVMEDGQGKVNFNVPAFRRALGSLRLMLKIGMGKEEEQVLKKCLRSVSNPCIHMYILLCIFILYTQWCAVNHVHTRMGVMPESYSYTVMGVQLCHAWHNCTPITGFTPTSCTLLCIYMNMIYTSSTRVA